jgi:catechol 2,3-dioxygenase-like lactoylglutathione lyase family enzyme
MIGYITIGALDTERAKAFYDSVLATIGWKPFADYGGYIGYGLDGADDGQTIWICKPFDGEPARAGNGIMVGFHAKTREQVHAFHSAAMAANGSDEGPPGPRPDYGPNWYAPGAGTASFAHYFEKRAIVTSYLRLRGSMLA